MKLLPIALALSSFAAWSEKFQCPLVWQEKVFTSVQLFEGHPKERMQLKPDNGDDPLPHFWSLEGKNFFASCEYKALGSEQVAVSGVVKNLKKGAKNCLTEKARKEEGVYRVINCE